MSFSDLTAFSSQSLGIHDTASEAGSEGLDGGEALTMRGPFKSVDAGTSESNSAKRSDSVAAAAHEERKRKRRVPESLRKRAEVSCDSCKKKKIGCVRPNGASEPCSACEATGRSCVATLPRKKRVYASEEQLSARYQALDVLVKDIYPDQDTESMEGLEKIGRERGISFPTYGNHGVSLFDAALPTTGPASVGIRPLISSHVFSTTGEQPDGIFRIPEGQLIPAPAGGFHYVGPASSFFFANSVRRLVSKCDLDSFPSLDGEGFWRYIRAAEFTSFSVSQALEARIPGHPVTNAAEDDASQVGDPPTITETFTGNSPSNMSTPQGSLPRWRLSDVLPSREVTDRLVRTFFDRVHPNFTIFHRGTFQTSYESIFKSGGLAKASFDPQPGWVCSVFLIVVLGAQVLDGDNFADASTIQQRLLSLVIKDGLHRLALTASLENVQALMLFALVQHNVGERNTAWLLLGMAGRTAIALGMHRDGETGNFDPIERNTRRMVWWVLHSFEQNLSLALGRPSDTDLIDVTASVPDETMIDGGDLPSNYWPHAIALTDISSRIKRFTASISTSYEQPDIVAKSCPAGEQLLQLLAAWRGDLPPHFAKEQSQFLPARQRRAVVLLHIYASHIESIIGRPFLLCRANHTLERRPQSLPDGIHRLAEAAVTAARSVMHSLHRLDSFDSLEGVIWLDFYYVHHATLILGVPFLERPITDRPADQDIKTAVSSMMEVAQKTRLAPTYRILLNVALQLAFIVGIGPSSFADISAEPAGTSLPLPPGPPVSATPVDHFASTAPASSLQFLQTDLYNFGLDPLGSADMWDFFNVGHSNAVSVDGDSGQ
ncbi:hypothetical protein T439DRAFT_295772 [Meredithblackwellia eburnea MCA 4105]